MKPFDAAPKAKSQEARAGKMNISDFNCVDIPTRRSGHMVTVDIQDFAAIAALRLHILKSGHTAYARLYFRHGDLHGKLRKGLLHRLLLNAEPHEQVDHIDGNGLNNRRSNPADSYLQSKSSQ